jgi:ABC-type Mn2+/Zn2+ transport system ATPase subunit
MSTVDDIPLIDVDGVSLGYGDHEVLRDLSLQVRSGEFWLLMGPNGNGKTTFVRALLGLHTPRQGTIRLHPLKANREAMGFVPQSCDFNPTLPTTVAEFVLLGLVGVSVPSHERGDRLRWALSCVGMESMERHDYWTLSGGYRQRALLARALVRRPSLLLLDEPTNGLDMPAAEAFLGALAHLHRTGGLSVLLVTHDLSIAFRYGTKGALFFGGTAISGPLDRMLDPALLEKAYGALQMPFDHIRCMGGAKES